MMTSQQPNGRKERVVILGGGFGGAYAAQRLEKYARKYDLEVILIDRRNYFVFTPLLIEAGTGRIEPRHAVVSIRSFLKKTRFLMGEALGLDEQKSEIIYRIAGTEKESRLEYDHLVLSLGGVTMMPPIPGLKEFGFELKSIADSVGLRDRAIQMLEVANTVQDEAKRRELLHFVFVGASYTGVEAAGEFSAFLGRAAKAYDNVSSRDFQITLVEMQDRILPTLDESLATYALENLTSRHVDIRLETTVKELTDRSVTLSTGDVLSTQTVVWTAGIAPNPLLKKLPFETDKRGYVLAERDLRVKDREKVWAIGDCAINPDAEGNPYPPTAQHATRQGKALANNILRAVKGQETEPCDIVSQGTLAAFGCYRAVARVGPFRLSGFPAWWLWRTVYLMKMPTWRRKVRVALDWTADLLFRRDIVQLGVHRIARTDERGQQFELSPSGEPEKLVSEESEQPGGRTEEDKSREKEPVHS